jgi:hypothetical protein
MTNYASYVSASIASGTFSTINVFDYGVPLTILNRTRDPSSNQVTFFDISNLFYGTNIEPGTLTLTDPSLSGSAGAISVTLKDDGYGGLYRADTLGQPAKWNSVGTVYYNEGIIAIKSPHLYHFGKDGYTLTFDGHQPVNTMKLYAMAPANCVNSSSSPNYAPISASLSIYDKDPQAVYISGIYFHDDNLNVVARANLAQPIMKRYGSRQLYKVAIDF